MSEAPPSSSITARRASAARTPPAATSPKRGPPRRVQPDASAPPGWRGALVLVVAVVAAAFAPDATVESWWDYLLGCAVKKCTLVRQAPVAPGPLTRAWFGATDEAVWVGGPAGQVLRSWDGGLTWEAERLPADGRAPDVLALVGAPGAGAPTLIDSAGAVWHWVDDAWTQETPTQTLEMFPGTTAVRVTRAQWAALTAAPWGEAWGVLAEESTKHYYTPAEKATTQGPPEDPGLPCDWETLFAHDRAVADGDNPSNLTAWCTPDLALRWEDGALAVVKRADLPAASAAALTRMADTDTRVAVGPGGASIATGATGAGGAWAGDDAEVRLSPVTNPTLPLRSNLVLPPWAAVVAGLGSAALFLLLPAWRRQSERAPTRTGGEPVASEALRSDAPIVHPGDDRLDLVPLARGLARFLRNPATEGPLTVAVTGEWGSGKSSLMRLVERELRASGARPAWFNAWHHHDAEGLIAAMIEQVIREVPPSALTVAGVWVRLRLAQTRLQRLSHGGPFGLAMLAGVAGACLAFLLHLATHLPELRSLGVGLAGTATAVPTDNALAEVLGVFAGVPVLAASWRGLRIAAGSLGARPEAVVEALRDAGSVGATARRVALTNAFARDFGDLCTALGPERRVVVFIDDIDRCSPEAVERVLEGVNFLTSSANCFVVLGMSKRFVLNAMATRLDARLDVKPENYLEKLINLEVPVPTPDAARLKNLDVDSDPPEGADGTGAGRRADASEPLAGLPWWSRMLAHVGSPLLQTGFGTVLVVGMATAGFAASDVQLDGWDREVVAGAVDLNSASGATPVATATSKTAADGATSDPAAAGGAGATPEESPSDTGARLNSDLGLAPGTGAAAGGAEFPWSLPVGLGMGALAGVAALLLLASAVAESERVVDPPGLQDALDRWRPLVVRRNGTPRAWKRFVNRARFLVMRRLSWAQAAPDLVAEERTLRSGLWLRPWTLPRYLRVLAHLREGDGLSVASAPARAVGNDDVPHLVALASLDEVFEGTPYEGRYLAVPTGVPWAPRELPGVDGEAPAKIHPDLHQLASDAQKVLAEHLRATGSLSAELVATYRQLATGESGSDARPEPAP